MKKILCLMLAFALLVSCSMIAVFASSNDVLQENGNNSAAENEIMSSVNLDLSAKAAVLMDAETGALLYAKSPNVTLPPASVTKIMTLLLVAEAIDDGSISLTDKVTVSQNASSMGGSQIFLKEGEVFTVEELLKSTVIASANDAAVALAEHVCGSESAFVAKMNERAKELGMSNTYFENTTGLDDSVTKHLTSAYDIALMSRELIKHDIILKYSNVWQDSIRNGEFVLTNTNRLVRYYSGCTGLKTGSTDKAGYCVSATAKRGNLHLIAVVLGSESRDERNTAARNLLDWGFASYGLYCEEETPLEDVPVNFGTVDSVKVYSERFTCLLNKPDIAKIEKSYEIPESLEAPLRAGDTVGAVIYTLNGEEIGRCNIIIKDDIDRISTWELFCRMISAILVG